MLWAVLGLINGKALLVGLMVGAVAFVATHWPRPNKEEDNE